MPPFPVFSASLGSRWCVTTVVILKKINVVNLLKPGSMSEGWTCHALKLLCPKKGYNYLCKRELDLVILEIIVLYGSFCFTDWG